MTPGQRVDLLTSEPPEALEEALVAPPLDAAKPSMQDAKSIPRLFMQENAFEEIELQACLDSINKSPGNWDTTAKRHKRDFGFELDRNGRIVGRAPPLPDACGPRSCYLIAMGQQLCPDVTQAAMNQMSVNAYAPSVGIGAHVDDKGLGEFVGIVSMGGGVTILFTSHGRRSPTHSMYMPAHCALILTGDSRHKFAHSIDRVGADLVNGNVIPRSTRHSIVLRCVPPQDTTQHDRSAGDEVKA